MPVSKQCRFVTSSPEQLNVWLGRESGKPVHVITPEADLTSELKRGVRSFVPRRSVLPKGVLRSGLATPTFLSLLLTHGIEEDFPALCVRGRPRFATRAFSLQYFPFPNRLQI